MKSLWCAIKSEVVKLRHTPIFLLHIIVPLLGGLLFAMYFHLYSGQQSITQRLNLILQATSAFFPLAISIAVSLGINLEEEGHFQALFVGMESKSKLIIAKLILFLGMGAVAIVILFLPILFSVAVMDQELSISVLNTVLYSYVYLILGNIVTYIIHFWLSLKSGLGASVITGVLESLIVILFSNLPLKLVISWEYIPWAWAVNMCRQEILQFNAQLSTLQPNIANYNEIQAEKTAKILETEKNPDYKNIPAGIKYLIISKEFDILNTNMSNGEQKDALRYANGKFEKTASGKQFILVTRDKEFCILQYYIGSHFTNIWLDIHMP